MRHVLLLVPLWSCVETSESGTSGRYVPVTSELGPVDAISGLAATREDGDDTADLWAVPDSAVATSRIYGLEVEDAEVRITSERLLTLDGNDVSYDLEGVEVDPGGGWWLAAEGDASSATSPNLLVHVNSLGEVSAEVPLPEQVASQQTKHGFEGVACDDDGAQVYLAFQRGWSDDPEGLVRIGRYTPATGEWAFYHYPLSFSPGQVGLSELAWGGDGRLIVLERDDLEGDESVLKQLTVVTVGDVEPALAGSTPPVLEPEVLRDLLADDDWPYEKAEGATLLGDEGIVVNDDDAKDDVPTMALLIDGLGDALR